VGLSRRFNGSYGSFRERSSDGFLRVKTLPLLSDDGAFSIKLASLQVQDEGVAGSKGIFHGVTAAAWLFDKD